MDLPGEKISNLDVLQKVVTLAAEMFTCQFAAISNVDQNNEVVVVSVGLTTSLIPLNLSLSKYIFKGNGIFIFDNSGKYVSEPKPSVKFYAGIALESKQNMAMCLWIADKNKRGFTKEDDDKLLNLSHIARYIIKQSSELSALDAKRLIDIQRQLFLSNRQLAETDARRKAILESIGDGVSSINDKGEIIYVNPSLENLTGWSSNDLVGKQLVRAIEFEKEDGSVVPIEERPIRNALYSNEKVTNQSYYCRRKNGSRFAASVTATPVNLFGQVFGGVSIMRDISKEKDIDKMKTEFISLSSHQLRTPLSSMKWFTEILLDGDAGDLTDKQKELIIEIQSANERMIQLVNTLLNISRIESGKLVVEPVSTDIEELVKDIIKELTAVSEERKVKINLSTVNDLPNITIDPKLVRQAYSNLISNAIKYSHEGGVIQVKLGISGNEFISEISDNGLGIPQGDYDKVFSKFFRASNVVSVVTEGTGLGLYLVKSIVEVSGGKIWFKSCEGEGTTFTFVLPVR
ncbi:PAS domain S-box protein [Candidatus Woesebacteria bacterium]|nr:MAG: PAS domain S-box protein [Candidatus Woesebacteria bacterium]